MKFVNKLLAVLVASAAIPVFAAPKTVTLDVPGMTCSLYPSPSKRLSIKCRACRKSISILTREKHS